MNSRLISARFDGKCRTCGKAVHAGEPVYFAKHYGVRCSACGPHTSSDQPLPPKKGSKRYDRTNPTPTPEPVQADPKEAEERKKRPIRRSFTSQPVSGPQIQPMYTPADATSRLTAELGADGIHRMMFASLSDVVEDAFTDWAVTEESRQTLRRLYASQVDSEWANYHSESSLKASLANPKAELIEAIESLRKELVEDLELPATPRRRVRRGQDWGDELDADRYLVRDPQGWSRSVRETVQTRTVTVGVNLTVHCGQSASELLYRGAAACALADVLTNRGVNVRIVGFSVGGDCSNQSSKLVTMVEIKASDMPLDMASLATALCDIGFCRMVVYFAEGRHLPGKVSGYLGHRGGQYLPGPDRTAMDYLVESRVTTRQAAVEWLKEQMNHTQEVEVSNV